MKRTKKPSRTATKLSQHIGELRWRLLACLVALAIGGAITYTLRDQVFWLLQLPIHSPLYYTTPGGSLSFVMRYCTIGAMIATIPMLAYHLIMFIRPAFAAHISKRRVYLTSLLSLFLALGGAVFGFTLVLPAALQFFAGFQMEGLKSLISADSYLSLVANILITFIIAFQIPLIVGFIDHIKPLKPSQLFKAEKWVILASLIISVLVPFAWDITTSLLIASPLVILYNLSIIGVLLQHAVLKKKRKPAHSHSAIEKVEDVIEEVIAEVTNRRPHSRVKEPLEIEAVTEPIVERVPIQSAQPIKVMEFLPAMRPAPRIIPPQRATSTLPSRVIQPVSRGRLITDITPSQADPAAEA